ncbi:MAG TPA: DUF819 family protein [Steroidobacteraceae bacterium]|nr:DUF819 family protein [Steroidobacteraceae bacterium]
MLTDPMAHVAVLAGTIAAIFWLAGRKPLGTLFKFLPPVIWCYFVPMLATTLGLLPAESAAYDWIRTYLLPASLLLLMLSIDVKSVLRLGPVALGMVVAGTIGIILGGPIAYLVFGSFLPPDAWTGFAALSGSWIGGTANMVAIAASVGTPDSALGPIIVVDTVVGYGWMGVLLVFSGWQQRFDQWSGARTDALTETNRRLAALDERRHPVALSDVAILLGLGLGGAVIAVELGNAFDPLGDPVIISHATWAVLIVVTVGLALSFTPVRRLEEVGASRFGYIALYLLMASIGAQADLHAVLQAPLYLAAGVVWIAVHVLVLMIAARLLRAPLFFIATGSMANIGGAASAPVVAGVYHPAMAPVGLLMAVAGYVLGIYGGLACAWLLARLAT